MPLRIPIASDFSCPWCWVGWLQAQRLRAEFGVEIEWLGYELFPEDMPWPESTPRAENPNRPKTLSRFEFLKLMDGVEIPAVEKPKRMRTFRAHQAVAFARHTDGAADDLIEALFRAFWERGRDIDDVETLREIAAPYVGDVAAMVQAIERGCYRDETVKFDADAYRSGVWNVPTFWIGDERYAEQPYQVLRAAVAALVGEPGIYHDLHFPPGPRDRPYVFINMVATIDGKILSGGRDEPVVDLGSELDHRLMKRIEAAADAVLLGAQTLRAAKPSWSPNARTRIVLTRSGDLPFESKFFQEDAYVAGPEADRLALPKTVKALVAPTPVDLLQKLRARGIERLLVLGGSTLNAELFHAGVVDEIFLTLAPKMKLGRDVPTIADGEPLPRVQIQNFTLIEENRAGDELFLRYRRKA